MLKAVAELKQAVAEMTQANAKMLEANAEMNKICDAIETKAKQMKSKTT